MLASVLLILFSYESDTSDLGGSPVQRPAKIILSDQELSNIDSGNEDIIVNCRPKVQPRPTFARTRHLPLMSETEDESSRAKRREPVSCLI